MKRTLISCLAFLALISCKIKSIDSSSHISEVPVLEPTEFMPGLISTKNAEFDLIFTKDNKTLFFTRRIGEEKQKIYTSHYTSTSWSKPVIASFSTDRDEYPNVTPDGNTLYFGSERPIPGRPNKGNFDTNIWKTERINGSWNTPVPLDSIINNVQAAGEEWPLHNENHFNTADGKTFYLCTMLRGEQGIDLYSTTLENEVFSKPEKLPPTINLEDKWEYAPKISPDGQFLFFQSYAREDGMGGDDIYVSKKGTNGQWTEARNLGPVINTSENETPFGMTSDGKYFFFGKAIADPDIEDGTGRIFFIETQALSLNTLFE
jgi:Tol biopolymer transport system component